MDKELDKTIKAILARDPQEPQEEEPRKRDLFSLKIKPEFRAALEAAWQADNRARSLTQFILNVLVDKLKWKGKV